MSEDIVPQILNAHLNICERQLNRLRAGRELVDLGDEIPKDEGELEQYIANIKGSLESSDALSKKYPRKK